MLSYLINGSLLAWLYLIFSSEGEYYIGRTEFDSPEVDPEVLIPVSEGTLSLGTFYEVKITDADDFDLYGTRMF